MTKNMGGLDRALRAIAAVILVYVVFGTGFAAAGLWHWLGLAVAAILALTAAVGVCPLYSVFGIRTCRT